MSKVYIPLILDDEDRVKDYKEDIMVYGSKVEAVKGIVDTLVSKDLIDVEDYIKNYGDHSGPDCICCNSRSELRNKLIDRWKDRLESVKDLEDLCQEVGSEYGNSWHIVIEEREIL